MEEWVEWVEEERRGGGAGRGVQRDLKLSNIQELSTLPDTGQHAAAALTARWGCLVGCLVTVCKKKQKKQAKKNKR